MITQNKGIRKSKLYKVRSNYFKNLLLKNELKDRIIDYNSIELKYWGSILPNEDYIDESSYLGLILENAASVAGMVLTTECALVDIKEDAPPAAPPMGGGMPGMM